MKMMHKVKIQTIIIVFQKHKKNVGQISGMAWLASPLCLDELLIKYCSSQCSVQCRPIKLLVWYRMYRVIQ